MAKGSLGVYQMGCTVLTVYLILSGFSINLHIYMKRWIIAVSMCMHVQMGRSRVYKDERPLQLYSRLGSLYL